MKLSMLFFAALVSSAAAYNSSFIPLATFDGAKGTTWGWTITNDPVMGGLSHSTWHTDKAGEFAVFNGTVEIVPSLKAPGFCKAETSGIFDKFPDVSSATHMILHVRSTSSDYTGYKVTFSAGTSSGFSEFKANFAVPAGSDFQKVAIPFSNFSNNWSPYTGDCDTKDPSGKQHYCCSSRHPEVCPTTKDLSMVAHVGVWAEGHAADFHIEVKAIGAGVP